MIAKLDYLEIKSKQHMFGTSNVNVILHTTDYLGITEVLGISKRNDVLNGTVESSKKT